MNDALFIETVWQEARELYRDMPWRRQVDPYYVLVSEIMLQQTQVDRVVPKFEQFIGRFPTITALARAPLADVLVMWSGLGYNRRARFLHQAARRIVEVYGGTIPMVHKELMTLPGVGANTAGALLAYSANIPTVFIETNIRTVYFYHYFPDRETVGDDELRELVARTVDQEHPREWYWALMDYGAALKRRGVGAVSKSRHYKRQSPLKGSVREVREVMRYVMIGTVLMALAGAFFTLLLTAPVSAQSVSLPDSQLVRIQSNCVSAKATLNQLHASDALLRVNRGQVYESVVTKLMDPFATRLGNNGLDNKATSAVATSYRSALDTFRTDYRQYEQKLSSAVRVDCQAQPADFYVATEEARALRKKVHEDVLRLNLLIDDYRSATKDFLLNYQRVSGK